MNDQFFQFLTMIKCESATETHAKGFTYLQHGFMPRLLEAGKIKGFDRELLATGWTRVGEIYALNEAPNRALECLRKALALVPSQSSTLLFLINQLILIGSYHEAFKYINLLLDANPDRMDLITLRQQIQDDMNYESEPQLQSGNIVWKLNEMLAAEQFNTVINEVLDTDMDDIVLLKKLASAYGAVGHNANYYQVWDTIKRINANVNIDPIDRFYRPLKKS